jgi:hypothetical protein
MASPILEFFSVSPDGKWLIALVPVANERDPAGVWAYAVGGGTPVRICKGYCEPRWDRAGKFFCVTFTEMGRNDVPRRTIVLPVPLGRDLPVLPPSGIHFPEDGGREGDHCSNLARVQRVCLCFHARVRPPQPL